MSLSLIAAQIGALPLPMDAVNLICEYISHLENSPWTLKFNSATDIMKRVLNKHSTSHYPIMKTLSFKTQNQKYDLIVLVFNMVDNCRSVYMRGECVLLSEEEFFDAFECESMCKYYLKCYPYEDTYMQGVPSIVMQYNTRSTQGMHSSYREWTNGTAIFHNDSEYDVTRAELFSDNPYDTQTQVDEWLFWMQQYPQEIYLPRMPHVLKPFDMVVSIDIEYDATYGGTVMPGY